MAMHLDRATAQLDRAVGGGGEWRFRHQLYRGAWPDNALTEGDRRDMPLAHRPQRHRDTHRPARQAALVRMRYHARVHQRGGGIAIFVTEIGADQLLLDLTDACGVEAKRLLDLR